MVLGHELAGGLLVGGVLLHQVGPPAGGAEEVQLEALQPLAGGEGPLLVPVVRQEVAGVAVGGCGAGGRVARGQRPSGRGLVVVGVDRDLVVRPQRHRPGPQDHRLAAAEGLAGVGGRLVQVGPRRLGVELGPQGVHHLLGGQVMVGAQGEEGDELSGPP